MEALEQIDASELEECKDSLHCYALLLGCEEATLGFGISLAFNGTVLVNARSPFEFLSYEAFAGLPDNKVDPSISQGTWLCAICNSTNLVLQSACLRCRAARPGKEFAQHQHAKTKLGVRQNSCGTEHFTHFLPLYISKEHFNPDLCARCLEAAWRRVLVDQVPETTNESYFREAIWNVLPALMNSTAVALVGGELHTSDVALRGYYHLHRLLLALASREQVARAASEVEQFVNEPHQRLKQNCPNLGHFLPRLLLLPDPLSAWFRIQEPLLEEALDRTVLHAHREFPNISAKIDDETYVQLRWKSASKGMKMLLFSVSFLKQAAKWGPPEHVAAHYDQRFGQASCAEREHFRSKVCSIKSVDSWKAFAQFWCMEAGLDSAESETQSCTDIPSILLLRSSDGAASREVLRQTERRSATKGYHGTTAQKFAHFKPIVVISTALVALALAVLMTLR